MTIFVLPLNTWDTGSESSYKVRNANQTLLFTCLQFITCLVYFGVCALNWAACQQVMVISISHQPNVGEFAQSTRHGAKQMVTLCSSKYHFILMCMWLSLCVWHDDEPYSGYVQHKCVNLTNENQIRLKNDLCLKTQTPTQIMTLLKFII